MPDDWLMYNGAELRSLIKLGGVLKIVIATVSVVSSEALPTVGHSARPTKKDRLRLSANPDLGFECWTYRLEPPERHAGLEAQEV